MPTLAVPQVTVVAPDAAAARADWTARHPGLSTTLDVRFVDRGEHAVGWADPGDPILAAIEADLPPTLHIFGGDDAEQALTAALALRDGMRRGARSVAPIAVRSDHRWMAGRDLAEPSGVLQLRLTVVDGYDTPVSPFGVIGRVLEHCARAFHAAYAEVTGASAFDRMPHSQRLSNRRAAYHLLEKLRLLGFEDALPIDRAYGIGPAGLRWMKDLPPVALRELDLLEHQRWRADRLIEGWRSGPRNSERQLRDNLEAPLIRIAETDVATLSNDRTQLTDFIAQAAAVSDGSCTPRIVDVVWEGEPPRWTRSPTLELVGTPQSPWPEPDGDAVHRLRLFVPPLPPGADADRDAADLRAALQRYGQALLARAAGTARLRFVRAAAHPWNWLEEDPARRIDGVTLPRFVVGFTGHRDPARLGDLVRLEAALCDELPRWVPTETPLISGLAPGGDALMVRLWHEFKLGPIHGVVPYLEDGVPAAGPRPGDRISAELVRICTRIEQPSFDPDAPGDHRHAAVADHILNRATILVAVSDGINGGSGGVEDSVAKMRARGGLVRYVAVATPDR